MLKKQLPPDRLERFLLILLMANLAIAQPLFDLLGRQAEFLVAHALGPASLVILAFALSVLLPVLLALLPVLARKIGALAGEIFFYLIFGLLAALTVIPVLISTEWGDVFILIAAGLFAGALVFIYRTVDNVRLFFKYLTPAVLIFPLTFLFFSRAAPLLLTDGNGPVSTVVTLQNEPDIVFLVLDEFPLVSLLTSDLEIDRERYPNFARLADQSNWYRAATTGADSTVEAIPEALTGREALTDAKMLPITSNYPRNLFTLLQDHYELTVTEMATQLCPRDVCVTASAVHGTGQTWKNRIADLVLIYAHIVTPPRWAGRLSSISQTWSGFTLEKQTPDIDSDLDVAIAKGDLVQQLETGSRLKQFEAWVNSIQPGPRPQLYYLHTLLPHIAWRYLPDGRQYVFEDDLEALTTFAPGTDKVGRQYSGPAWEDDEIAVQTAWQRHILQVRFVDMLLGELLDRLQDQDMLESSLIVVTGDHGASFIPGQARRSINAQTLTDISGIPLFIKLPEQNAGRIIETQASLIDILPTISQTLGLSVDWQWSGSSLLDDSRKPHQFIKVKNGVDSYFSYPANQHMPHLSSRAKEQGKLFGRGTGLDFFRPGMDSALVGTSTDNHKFFPSESGKVIIRGIQLYRDVDLDGGFIPRLVKGDVDQIDLSGGPVSLAISLNGVIQAVTRTYVIPGFEHRFAVLLPPGVLLSGENKLRVFVIYGRSRLVELAQDAQPVFNLNTSTEPHSVSNDQNQQFPIKTGANIGRVVSLEIEGADLLDISGSVSGSPGPPGRVVAFRNGSFAGSSRLENGSFSIPVRVADRHSGALSALRVFAIVQSSAFELDYPGPCSKHWHFVAPPGWNEIDCSAPALNPLRGVDGRLEASLDFGDASTLPYMVYGWEMDESGISWTISQSATLEIPIPPGLHNLSFTARIKPFLHAPALSSQALWIMANGQAVYSSSMEQLEFTDISWSIDQEIISRDTEKLTLTWLLPDAVSPQAVGAGEDVRVLGLAVFRLDIMTDAD